MKLPAFVVGERLGLLPAFTRFSGGTGRVQVPGARRFVVLPGELPGEADVIELGAGG